MRQIKKIGNLELFDDTEVESGVDTGNRNYHYTWIDTWFRVYKDGKQLKAFLQQKDAEVYMQNTCDKIKERI